MRTEAGIPAGWSLARTGVLAAAAVAGVQILLLFTTNAGVLHGALFDPDCYMHLQRALRMMEQGTWRDVPDPRINAPYGALLHWTALFDLLLVAGAEPLRLAGLDAHAALYVWGSAISPVLLMAALAMFAWGVRPWVRGAAFLWLTVLMFTQPEFSGAFLAGRPDHQSLIIGLFLAQLGWLYAVLDGRAGPRWAIGAGVLAGVQMCTSVEALLTVLTVAATLGIAWTIYRQATVRALALYLAACVATIFLWISWQGGWTPLYDRPSIVQLVALGSGALCFGILALAEGRLHAIPRVLAFAGAGLVSAAITAAIYPDFFLGPWPHLDPVIRAWHKTISELQPLLPTDGSRTAQFLAQFTAPLLGLPLALRSLFRERRLFFLPSLTGFVLFGGLALAQMRWSAELQAAMLLPWTLTTIAIMKSSVAVRFGKVRLPLRSVLLSGALLLQMVPAALAHGRAATLAGASHDNAACPWRQAIDTLPADAPRGSIVMTEVWYGPEILWRTELRVVDGPYEIAPALDDTNAFFNGSAGAARAVALRRGLDFVLVCKADASAFTRRSPPAWLSPVALPPALAAFRLYRVAGR